MKFKGFFPVLAGLLLWLLGPPEGLDTHAYHLFVVFLTVIASLMVRAVYWLGWLLLSWQAFSL